MSIASTLPSTDTMEGRTQLSLDYLRNPQATALRALTLTSEDLTMTSNIAYNPPPDVAARQIMSCGRGGSVGMYFHYAIVSIDEPHCDNAAEEAREVIEIENGEIVEMTRAFLATAPAHLEVDESIYIFSDRIIDQLLPVARRAFELLREDPATTSVHNAYLELRTAVTMFINHFKLPSLFCDALGLALEVVPGVALSRTGLPPRVLITEPGPVNPVVFPFVYHSGIVKEIIGVFKYGFRAHIEDHLLLLRSPSRNSSNPQLSVFDLEQPAKFPGILEQCLQDSAALYLFIQTGRMDRWRGKRWTDFRILGVASTSGPSSTSDFGVPLTYIFAESIDGNIEAQWWHAKECEIKFGAPKVVPAVFIHQAKTGQISQELEHHREMQSQLDLLDQERHGGA